MTNLTKRTVDSAAPKDRDYFIWCGGTRGFGVRVYPSGAKMFVAQLRVGRSLRRIKIGAYGPFTVEQARETASELIRTASLGRDPQREKREAKLAMTVSELLDTYMEAARNGLVMTRFRVPKRPSTVALDQGWVTRHLKPLIGSIPAKDLRRADVQKMADQVTQGHTRGVHKGKPRGKAVVKGGPGTAARAVSLLGGIYTWAEKRDLVPGPNPARNVDTIRFQPRDRYLSTSELTELGKSMAKAEEGTQIGRAHV